jgi:hypothetical protein
MVGSQLKKTLNSLAAVVLGLLPWTYSRFSYFVAILWKLEL